MITLAKSQSAASVPSDPAELHPVFSVLENSEYSFLEINMCD